MERHTLGSGAMSLVSLADVEAAAARIRGRVRRTPLLATDLGPGGSPLWLKAESLQVSGSFKIRGALNAISLLSDDQLSRGVVTHSSGNHAQAVARAARSLGVGSTVVMPRNAPEVKRAATEALGARVVLVDAAERETAAAAIEAETGAALIPPYDHRDV